MMIIKNVKKEKKNYKKRINFDLELAFVLFYFPTEFS